MGQAHSSSTIRVLPDYLIDQIKAGEVVERPSNVLKELLENALDAKASKITIDIRGNGLDSICVEDNGKGMSHDDLPLAYSRHATSKITKLDDLFRLNSFGFRGEALASIASIARMSTTSYSLEKKSGGKIELEGGHVSSLTPLTRSSSGTSITVRDLFFNTPVRLKFLKSKLSEKNALRRTLDSFLIDRPDVTFRVSFDQKSSEYYPPVESWTERFAQILGLQSSDSESLLFFESHYEELSLEGVVNLTKGSKSKKRPFLFVNHRILEDPALYYGPKQMLKSFALPDYVTFCLKLQAPPHTLDPNTHPHKTQIKFEDTQLVKSFLTGALKQGLQGHLKKNAPSSFSTPSLSLDHSGEERPLGEMSQVEKEKQGHRNLMESSSGPHSFLSEESTSPFSSLSQNLQSESSHQEKEFSPQSSKKSLYSSLFHMRDISLVVNQERSELLLIQRSLLFSKWAQKKWDHFDFERDTRPLLVSSPLPSVKELSFPLHDYQAIGLVLDRLENGHIILRALPRFLQATRYREVLPLFLNQDLKGMKGGGEQNSGTLLKAWRSFLSTPSSFRSQGQEVLNELLNEFSIDQLRHEGLAHHLKEEDFISIVSSSQVVSDHL